MQNLGKFEERIIEERDKWEGLGESELAIFEFVKDSVLPVFEEMKDEFLDCFIKQVIVIIQNLFPESNAFSKRYVLKTLKELCIIQEKWFG